MLDAGLPANIEISAKDPIGAECTVPLSAARIASAKRAFTTRNIDFSDATRLLTANTYPEIGDLVLARVVRTGQHRRIELPCHILILLRWDKYYPSGWTTSVGLLQIP